MMIDMMKIDWRGSNKTILSADVINNIPYATQAIKIDTGPVAITVLAWKDNDDFKWITADNTLIVTRHGRLVSTVGYKNELIETLSNTQDPLSDVLSIQTGDQWSFEQGWSIQKQWHSAKLIAKFSWDNNRLLTLFGVTKSYRVLDEVLTVEGTNTSYKQKYWIDPENGRITQSMQVVYPHGPRWNLVTLKPYTL